MEYAPHLAQFRRLLAMVRGDRAEFAAAQPFELPADIYWRPERFSAEMEAVFRRLPQVLGHAALLPKPGDTLVADLPDRPLLLVRGRDGEIRGFLNVCRHRGTRLCNRGERDNALGVQRHSGFTCPYHHWTYDLDGRLKHVPLADSFPGLDPATRGLTPVPLAVREGVIFGIPQADAAGAGATDIDGFLQGLDADLAVFGFAGLHAYARAVTRRRTNWKLVIDAFLESYHVVRLHRNTVGPFFLDAMAVMDCIGPHTRSAVARQEFGTIAGLPEAQWNDRLHASFAYLLFPNTVLVIHPDYVSILTLFPLAADETEICHVMLTPHAPRDEREDAHWQRSFRMIEGGVFQAEDLQVAEQAQIGMASGANRTLVYGRHEAGIRHFHAALDARLGTTGIIDRPG
ncbi:aromatic ring-hydroxylating dioxygenase subunit alpha [Ferrovibrio sp.]|uniref:aromatic ring-hydroxylating oxygenase subunit alpha n=1 Tax=Ferrovibrio sp. TaxID=1917215 RepID=UPI003513616E